MVVLIKHSPTKWQETIVIVGKVHKETDVFRPWEFIVCYSKDCEKCWLDTRYDIYKISDTMGFRRYKMIKPVPKTVILQAHEVAEEPAQIIITWNFEICRLCGSTDTAHNLKPEEFDHDFMGELKRANGN